MKKWNERMAQIYVPTRLFQVWFSDPVGRTSTHGGVKNLLDVKVEHSVLDVGAGRNLSRC